MRQVLRLLTAVMLMTALLWQPAPEAAAAEKLRTVTLPGPPMRVLDSRGQVRLVPREAVADRLLVTLRPAVRPQQGHRFARLEGARISKLLRCGLAIVELPRGSDLQAAMAALATDPQVATVEPDTFVYPAYVPNDPEYPQQYHLPLIDAPEGWDVTRGSTSVVVAVIDSGTDLDHPDLAAKIYTNPGEIPGNGIDDDENGYTDDVHGWDLVNDNNDANPEPVSGFPNVQVSHGTLTAGIIAAVGDDGWGTAGIDWNCKILPVQVFPHDAGSPISRVTEAVDYAVDLGVDIINLSLGGSYSLSWDAALHRAYDAGVLVIVAAGNDDREFTDSASTWRSPVCNDGRDVFAGDNYLLGVAATDQYERRHDLSNYDSSSANFVDVAAPGVSIYGPAYYDPSVSGFDQYFYTNTGTSFACPMVAGLAALILSVHPGYTHDQLIQLIRDTTDNIDAQNPGYAGKLGTGRINIAAALGVTSPPDPVTFLQAFDTQGDDGGSITLSWIKSADDGGGKNNVTEYIVFRREGEEGDWEQIDTLSPGTQLYVDDTTTDGVDYYYKVRTSDGELFRDSEVVGPMQSRNDAPPTRVTDLVAMDHPDDGGEAIDLMWTYEPPADYAETRIYRRTRNFNHVQGLTPIVVLPYSGPEQVGTLEAVNYTDNTTTDGVDYYYAVTGVDSADNEDVIVITAGPVQSYPNGNVDFAAGLHMLGPPAIPPDSHPATLLGIPTSDLLAVRWDTASERYTYYGAEPLPENLRLALGKSLWLNLLYPVSVTPSGSSAPAGDFDIALAPGWHQLGNPFFGAFDFGACTVTVGTETMDLLAADLRDIMRSFAWVYDRDEGDYRLVNADTMGNRLIAPWQGFWVLALQTCTLTLVRPTGPLGVPAQPASEQTSGWTAQLCASGGGTSDTQNWCGVRPTAQLMQIEAPPPVGDGVQLSFVDDRPGSRPLAASFVNKESGNMKWNIVVSWSQAPGEVRITWPDLSQVPPEYSVALRDLDSGKVISARHQPGYVFRAEKGGGTRRLEVEFVRRSGRALMVSAMCVRPTSGGGEIVFHLSQVASCDIRVLNIAGRPVRVLESGRVRPAGSNVVLWDGRNGSGARVPNGLYLVRIAGSTDAGVVANALAALRVQR